ncbi:MAG: phage tail protein [Enterobacterales bacterium]|nr:phage tail protein [Enterobacterales bacterium]MDN6434114.1 phage tail protein [Lacticaseibacillus paracasei]MDN6448274.1 phage tail protein [Enterobacterales bacterium]
MLKPKSLRSALEKVVPALTSNPKMLQMSIDSGSVTSTLAASLSFEQQYQLNLKFTNYSDDIEQLLAPINLWLRENQPDIMVLNEDKQNGFTFRIDGDAGQNITIALHLTERTLVKCEDGTLQVITLPEPLPPQPVDRPTALYINGELVSRWVD